MAGNPFIIVAGVKLDDPDDLAFHEALELAARTPGSELHLCAVIEPIADVVPRTHEARDEAIADAVAQLTKKASGALDDWTIRENQPPPIARVQVHGEYGHAAQALVMLADLVEADVLVVGMKSSRGVKGFLLGTVAENAIRSAGCTVIVARPKTTAEGPHPEPVCPDCLTRRQETQGAQLWCARHSEHHPRAHAVGYNQIGTEGAQAWGFSEPPPTAS